MGVYITSKKSKNKNVFPKWAFIGFSCLLLVVGHMQLGEGVTRVQCTPEDCSCWSWDVAELGSQQWRRKLIVSAPDGVPPTQFWLLQRIREIKTFFAVQENQTASVFHTKADVTISLLISGHFISHWQAKQWIGNNSKSV